MEEKTSDSPHNPNIKWIESVFYSFPREYGFYSIKHKDSGGLGENKKK